MMPLGPIEIVNGIFSIITVIFSAVTGLYVIYKYFEHKKKWHLFIGYTMIGVFQIWWGTSISFIFTLISQTQIPDPIYMVLGNILFPLTAVVAIYGLTELIFSRLQKLLTIIYSIYGIFFEIIFIVYLFIDYTALGKINSPVDASYGIFVSIFHIFLVFSLVIFGSIFALKLLKNADIELKIRGILLLLGFIFFLFGAFLDIVSEIHLMILVIGRIILIFSSFLFAVGFVLPEWLRKLLIRA